MLPAKEQILVVDVGVPSWFCGIAADGDGRVCENGRFSPERLVAEIEIDRRLRLDNRRGPQGVTGDILVLGSRSMCYEHHTMLREETDQSQNIP